MWWLDGSRWWLGSALGITFCRKGYEAEQVVVLVYICTLGLGALIWFWVSAMLEWFLADGSKWLQPGAV